MKLFLKIMLLIILIIAVSIAGYFFVGSAKASSTVTFGVDFSQTQAAALGLDWKETYAALLTDLGVKHIKLHTQWDLVEPTDNQYDFSDVDWQLQQAQAAGADVIYVVGVKTGRWPECHMPGWASKLDASQQQSKALDYLAAVVGRYKNNPAIAYWQVENEPLFKFGQCPDWYYSSPDFLKKEIALVKSLDPSRQTIISDSGEGSLWFKAAQVGDIVGTTLYRQSWFHITDQVGFYAKYFLPPVFYGRKALLVDKLFGKKVICVELQAEPWDAVPFDSLPVAQQEKTMNLQILQSNVAYAKQTGLDTFYFWGAEWWYYLKALHNQPDIWNYMKTVFQS